MEENLFQVYFKFINLNPLEKYILEYKYNNQDTKYEIKKNEYHIYIKKKKFEFKLLLMKKKKIIK